VVLDKFTFENSDPNDLRSRKGVDVDGDGLADITHGEAVSTYIRERMPDAQIIPSDLSNQTSESIPQMFNAMADQIVLDRAQGRRPIDAINLSQTTVYLAQGATPPTGSSTAPAAPPTPQLTTVEELGKVLGMTDLTPQNIHEKRQEIKNRFAQLARLRQGDPNQLNQYLREKGVTLEQVDGYLSWWPTIQAIERVTGLGVPVYLGAGNSRTREDGQHQINLFSLADGVVAVGALDQEGRPIERHANNSLITQRARGSYETRVNPDGIDITGDGRTDIPNSRLTGGGRLNSRVRIEGTSFAAPTLLTTQVGSRLRQPGGATP
jgi:hypothetical protein